ncbi:U11/U12 small nuclear ribonucleoprotein 48 kDa protein [Cucurbita argyrosperma subsp. argyrosperma]|nr:U11/U12 small nuclear ribonucleoprotein 48 kDa protein [Cucurbita argyrosperma subsp. argyrosperma]
MNPSLPSSNLTYPKFQPSNPNPNPNFSLPESRDPPLDLSSSLYSLRNLIHVANQTLQSLSYLTLIQIPSPKPDDSGFVQCNFDRRHRVPTHSLFHHSLLCPSAPPPRIDPTQLLQSLLYPRTLQSSRELVNEKRFRQTMPDSDADLCFSLNDYSDGSSNFFYLGCPGVVALSNRDEMSKVFSLPRVLAVECANFVCDDDGDRVMKSSLKGIIMLPSDLWALRSEVEMWNDYPSVYSHIVIRSILGSEMAVDNRLKTWIIANSPRYGVIIDVAMRDHIFLLFRLCFMAISKEAMGFQIALENGNGMEGGSGNLSFKCPILVQVLLWLASQLSVLYGEMNGKFFAINMLRQHILYAASGLSLLPYEQKRVESPTLVEGSHNLVSSCSDTRSVNLKELDKKVINNVYVTGEETVNCRVIFVSQVAAAVAALHERFLLEEKIKALRFSHLQTKHQLVSEHNYISQRACEERKRRCNYRPIIEHDGLPKQQSHDEDRDKTKTKEELLAEERDYKRRRMSYRGKKAKRSTLQVTRDIIEEYMDEIMKAGGIGYFVKGTEERGIKSEQPTDHYITRDSIADGHTKGSNSSYGETRHHTSSHSRKQSNYDNRYSASEKPPKGRYGHYGSPEDERKSVGIDKYDREHYHRFSDRSSSPSQSHKWKRYPSDRDDEKPAETRHHKSRGLSSSSSNYHGFRSSSSSRSGGDSSARKAGHKLRASDSWKRNTADNHSSDSSVLNSFNDRYTPSKCHDQLEDDHSTGRRYVNPDEL